MQLNNLAQTDRWNQIKSISNKVNRMDKYEIESAKIFR